MKAFNTATIIGLLSYLANAHPLTAAQLTGEDLPWQLSSLSIVALPSNATGGNQTSHISFVAVDPNTDSGLNFTTMCSALAPSVYSTSYTKCAFKNAGFSLRTDGTLWFQRFYEDDTQPAPFNGVICNGNWDTKQAEYYSNGPAGLIVYQPRLEIACTQMSS